MRRIVTKRADLAVGAAKGEHYLSGLGRNAVEAQTGFSGTVGVVGIGIVLDFYRDAITVAAIIGAEAKVGIGQEFG